jgi:hypothetical protein
MEDQTTGRAARHRRRYRGRGCGCGCAGFFLVLTVGIVLSLFNTDVGIGVSARIPFTSSNVTVAGSVGSKTKAVGTLPYYTAGRLGGNQNFFNNSSTMTIGPAEGTALVIIGKQDDAPAFDLHVEVH